MAACEPSALIYARLRRLDFGRLLPFCCPDAARSSRRRYPPSVMLRRPLEDRDLDTIYQQVTDPESVRMAAFTAEDQTDRRAFLNRMSRVRADTSASCRVIDVDGAIAGTIASFRIDDQPEVTFWVDRTQWGKGIASAALQILLAETAERPLYARAASDNVGSLRVLEKAG